MSRCGRCGLWNSYPDDYHEKKWAGVCLWYQIRLHEHDVWEERQCGDFMEAIPQLSPMQHLDYKVKRDNLGDAYQAARRSKRLALTSLAISVTGLALALYRTLTG